MKNQQGFTLIEIVIVIGVSMVLLVGLFQLFDWHQKVFVLEEATVLTTTDVRLALLSMTKYIAQANNIEASRVINGTTYTTGGSALVVKVPSVNASDGIIANTYDYVTYYLSNGSVYQIIETGSGSVRPGGTKVLAKNIQTFSLTYNNGVPASASAVTVDMQTSISTRTNNVSAVVSDTIFLRNQ